MDLRERGWHGMDWPELAQNREQWRAIVKAVMNLLVPKIGEILNNCKTGRSQECFSYMEFATYCHYI
jgi:hypothetical protein